MTLRGPWSAGPATRTPIALLASVLLLGCGSQDRTIDLRTGARPIGTGPRFNPPLREGPVPGCRPGPLGDRFGVHLELFGNDKVVLFPAGIGTRPPRRTLAGRISGARCFGPLVTIDPSGLVLVRRGTRATVGDVFALWGQPLGPGRAAGFRGRIRTYVNGRRVRQPAARIPLGHHDQIVMQVGPYVPPHARYVFPAPY